MSASFLLNSGHRIPLVGFGTFQIRSRELIFSVLEHALAAGYRHIDTAVVYRNEEHIGEALKTLLPKFNLQREDIFITSKLIPSLNQTEEDVVSLVKQSLKNLQTDYIDLYLIHWPGVSGLQSEHKDNSKYRNNTWATLIKLHQSGLIRSIGVSNYLIRHLEELKASHSVIPSVNQVEWHPHCHDLDLLKYCRDNGIFLQAYSSLGSSNVDSLRHDPTIIKVAQALGKSPAQILLRWALQQNIGILPKASSKSRIVENINLDFVLPDDVMNTLTTLQVKRKYAWDPKIVH
ncbi:CLUMA_CG017387, isoform A [Clunio marinus]|uniref:CLUMA_CG017387, isoform A n=1 Tax=Clunio marinus TaxID=568069 RepID=A0A1J1J0C5_9DIPT|nr:CLUMA_CG017387, isoform A [Clunio marinus]